MSEIKEVKIECKSCKTDFFWKLGEPDQRCPRCQLMWGQDIDKVLVEMRKQNFAGQEHVIHVLRLMSGKIAAIEGMVLEIIDSNTKPPSSPEFFTGYNTFERPVTRTAEEEAELKEIEAEDEKDT